MVVERRLEMRMLLILAMFQMASADEPTRMRRETVALTILAEARGEGKMGMYLVACVIQQRAIERKLSPDKVCRQPSQFECWDGKEVSRSLFRSTSAPYALFLAEAMVEGRNLDRKVAKHANHYWTLDTNPKWAKGHKPVLTFKGHKFFRFK